MKKIFSVLFVLMFALLLVACGEVSITFDSNGGTAVAAIEAKAGEKIVKPADPTLADMTFGGWCSDIDLTEDYEFPEVMPEGNITLYAKWNVTLSFDSNGAGEVPSITGPKGQFFNLPENPKKDGYVFVGWFSDKEFTKHLVTVLPQKNITAYAKWQVYETGSALKLSSTWVDNDRAFIVTKDAEGTKFTATSGKGEWSYVFNKINCNAKANTTVVIEFKGTKDCPVVFKLEGGNAEVTENKVIMTGENQKLEWSVQPSNLTDTGNQMFMFFLNGGVVGCGETPEYIQIKSVSLYRTVETGVEQKSAIYFVTNTDTPIAALYDKAGTAVTKPADPVKEGYEFKGWYTESTFENLYTFSTMPTEGTVLYARFDPLNVQLKDVKLMGETWVIGTEGTYELSSTKELITIKKTATGGEWDYVAIPMTGKTLGGYNLLRVAVKGTKGAEIMFKINDQGGPCEQKVVCTGNVQHFEFPFDIVLNPEKSLVVFANPGKAGASDVFEITELAYGNYPAYMDLLGKEWRQNDDGLHTITVEEAKLTISKASTAGTEWHAILLDLPEAKLNAYNAIKLTVKGTKDEQLLVKVNDNGAGETWVKCTGEVQELLLPFTLEFDMTKAALVLFANGGAVGTGNTFEITELAFVTVVDEGEPLIEEGNIDLLDENWQPLDETGYVVSKQVVISKATTGGEWNCSVVNVPGADLTGLNKLLVTVKGTKDQEIMFKINDQGGDFEKKILCTGEVQELSFDLVNFKYLADKANMIVFCNPGAQGTGNEFVITKLVLETAENKYDLLNTGIWKSLDEGLYVIKKQVNVYKEAVGGEWSCMAITASRYDFTGVNKLVVTIKGTKDEEIMFKINDQGGPLEKKVVCTGEVQTVEFEFEHTFLTDKATMIIFCNPGVVGTGNEFVVSGLTLVRAE